MSNATWSEGYMYVPKTRRNGTSSSLVHPVWPTTNDEWWTFIPSDEEKGTRVRDIESRFGPEPRPRRHIWAVFFKTGCLIWYRRQPPCERGLVLRRIEAAGRTDVARSSSFRYTSVRRNFTQVCRPTGKHHLTWPSNTILLFIARSRFRQVKGLRGNHVFHTDRSIQLL